MKFGCLKTGLAAAALTFLASVAGAQQLEKTDIVIAVGGKSSPNYLTLTAAEQLGFFEEEGLNVTINDFNSGSKSIQALVGGSVDAVVGYFDHAVHMQAKGQNIVSIVQLGLYPSLVLAKRGDSDIEKIGDLAGKTVGVTGPGSSTHFLLNHLLDENGIDRNSVTVIGVGVGQSVVAAIDQKRVDALVQVEPVMTMLTRDGKVEVMVDTRTLEGTNEVYGGPYPAAVLMASSQMIEQNPNTTQALVNAFVKTLHWIGNASPEEIVEMMPENYQLGDKALYTDVIRNNKGTYSPDGIMDPAAAETAVTFLSGMDESVAAADVNAAEAYDNSFAEAAQ